jgi:hypothetical protein
VICWFVLATGVLVDGNSLVQLLDSVMLGEKPKTILIESLRSSLATVWQVRNCTPNITGTRFTQIEFANHFATFMWSTVLAMFLASHTHLTASVNVPVLAQRHKMAAPKALDLVKLGIQRMIWKISKCPS